MTRLRQDMPETAAFIDALREAFGRAAIDAQIRAGLAGVPGRFFAQEGGHEVGTPPVPVPRRCMVSLADMILTAPEEA